MSRQVPFAVLLCAMVAACHEPTTPAVSIDAAEAEPLLHRVATPGITIIMNGLDSPRGLAFGPDGALYVAEAGTAAVTGACVPVFRGQNCFSGSGAVTRWKHGRQSRVASGLPSAYNPATRDIIGPHDIGFIGRGNASVVIGWGANPADRAGLGVDGKAFGHLIQLSAGGRWKPIADISAVEATDNPAGGNTDSNPYGVLVTKRGWFVTDAGGNTLLTIARKGQRTARLVTTFAATPAPPPFLSSEAVPTAVQRGPDGALYVSKLTGAPFLPGAASILRLAGGAAPEVFLGGFKTIIDFAFARDGGVYVLEYDTNPGFFFGGPGRLTHVSPDGTRAVLTSALTRPTSVAEGPDGAVYVSNRGSEAATGEVWRIVR